MNASVAADIPENPDIFIFLGGLKNIRDEASAIAVNRETFLAAKRIAKHFTQSGGVFITVQDTGGDFGLSGRAGNRVWIAGLTGLVKTSAIEWPKATVKTIDIDRGKQTSQKIAQAIFDELFTGGPEIEVGIHEDGSRFHLDSLPGNIRSISSK